MAHPLSGADLTTLRRIFAEAGPAAAPTAAIWAAAYGRWPSTALERWIATPRLTPADQMAPPIFILGHWRSGTTHLYNVMAEGGFGFVPPVATGLPWDLLGLGRALRPLLDRALPKSRYIDAIPVTPDSPQEDEFAIANMTPLSFYHAVYFPQHFERLLMRGLFFDGCDAAARAEWEAVFTLFMRKLDAHQGGRRLLMKNPVHTARVAQIRRVFPGAKFIHIHRDPFAVFASMRNFYAKLLPVMALQPYDHLDIDGAILRVYARMMGLLVEDTSDLAAPDFVEIAYADLDADPMGALRRIYRALALDGFDAAAPRFEAYLARVATFQKNSFRRDPAAEARVAEHWAPFIERWGYAQPAPA